VRAALLVAIVVVLAAVGASRFWPTVERIEVVGTVHLGEERVLRAARLAPGDPLLWITRWRVAELLRDPWVARARVTRHWPDTVAVTVWERRPHARSGTGPDATVWARDGTVLPGATVADAADLPIVTGWGRDRLAEALELASLLRERRPEVIQYSPEGFEIALSDARLFTPDADVLRRHWAAVDSHRGGRLAVYPWGVSASDE
jgi:cell division protein FtsQ